MRISRLHIPISSADVNQTFTITGDKAHYIRSVLRLKIGQAVIFFTNDAFEYKAIIEEINRHDIVLTEIESTPHPTPTSGIDTTIVQAISAGDRMDYTVQKCAEMGANRLIPVFSEYCNQKIPTNKYAKKQAHWQAVANSACEQSGRCDLLNIQPISTINHLLTEDIGNGIYLEPTAQTKLQDLPEKMQNKLTILIGPEGGFSEVELDTFKKAGLMGIQLGPRILRTETAAPVILAAVHTLFGDFC